MSLFYVLSSQMGFFVTTGEFRSNYCKKRLQIEPMSNFKTLISLWVSGSWMSFVWGVAAVMDNSRLVIILSLLLFKLETQKSIYSPSQFFLKAWCVIKSLFKSSNRCFRGWVWAGKVCSKGCEQLWNCLQRFSLLQAMQNIWAEERREGWHLD